MNISSTELIEHNLIEFLRPEMTKKSFYYEPFVKRFIRPTIFGSNRVFIPLSEDSGIISVNAFFEIRVDSVEKIRLR
jgi:hypothetical protein